MEWLRRGPYIGLKILRRLLVIPLILLTVLASIPASVSPVRAQQGVVCIATPDTTDCSSAPGSFSGSSTITVAVNIDGSDAFNGFDVSVQTDPHQLRPVSNDLTGSILGTSPFVLTNIDDSLSGVAEVAAISFQPIAAPATGRLFAINYKVVGNTFNSAIDFEQGCIGQTSAQGFCVIIAHGSTAVPESTVGGTFTGGPDFTISSDRDVTTTGQGAIITLQSLNGYQGVASLSTQVFPAVNYGPVGVFNTTMLTLLPFNTNVSKLSFSISDLTPAQNYTVVVTATANNVSHSVTLTVLFQRLSVSTAFTLSGSVPPPFPPPLPLDSNGNPKVNIVMANLVVTSTNPGEVDFWINASDTGLLEFRSLQMSETLPFNWVVTPPLNQSQGGLHVYYMYLNQTIREITPKTAEAVSNTNPEVVTVSFPDLRASRAGKFLDNGEKVIFQVKLSYAPIKTVQHARNFPIVEVDSAMVSGFSDQIFSGFQFTATPVTSFTAYAKVVGDANGDFKVDIVDVAIVAFAFGAKKNSARWSDAADINGDGVIDILDVALAAYYFGTNDW